MSPSRLDPLLEVLGAEERIYRELRQILAHERTCMLELDAAGLYELVRRKEALSDEGRLAAEARAAAAGRLAESLGISEEAVTVSRLCVALGDESEPLRDAQSRLLSLVAATRELAEANRALGGDRLGQVRATLELLGRVVPGPVGLDDDRGGRLVRTSA